MKFNTSLKLPFYGPFYYALYGRSLQAHILPFSRNFIKIPTIFALGVCILVYEQLVRVIINPQRIMKKADKDLIKTVF